MRLTGIEMVHVPYKGGALVLTDMIAGLRYVDVFERRSAEWRILERVIAYSWRRTDPAVGQTGFADTYVRGIRGFEDIVYTIGTER